MFPPNLVEACFKQVKVFHYFQLNHNKVRNWNIVAFSLGISCTCTYSRNKSYVYCQLSKKPNANQPNLCFVFNHNCLSICYEKWRKHTWHSKSKPKFFQKVKCLSLQQASLKSIQNLFFKNSLMLNYKILRYAPSVQRLEEVQECHVRNVHRFKTEATILWTSITKSNEGISCHLW